MADIEPPSFSLGLDLDFEPETLLQPPTSPPRKRSDEDEDDDFQLRVSDSDLDDPTPTRLQRLRRGAPSSSKPISTPNQCSERSPTSNYVANDDDDDIQDFSSEERPPAVDLPAAQHHSLCSSSKLPLSGRGILASQQETKTVKRTRKEDPSCPSTSLDASRGKSMFMDLTTSPLRRFRLLDSDSDSDADDLSESRHIGRDANGLHFSKKNEQKESARGCHQSACEEKINSSTAFSQKQDLWQDFYAEKSSAIPTPAFDEFCKEYFSTSKERRQSSGSRHQLCSSAPGKCGTQKMMQSQDVGPTDPPFHRYFFHNDLRIQRLVSSRLPYFHPLGASGEVQSFNASPIDYMSQFGHRDGAKQQTARQANVGRSSGRTQKKSKKSNLEETAHASGGWVNPKQAVSCPKDAGQRRVRADGQSSGHWFTDENGKKVYVTKTGKELRGRPAYKSYRQENGRGFRRFKKKSASKKK